jgi:hypothetical protein
MDLARPDVSAHGQGLGVALATIPLLQARFP